MSARIPTSSGHPAARGGRRPGRLRLTKTRRLPTPARPSETSLGRGAPWALSRFPSPEGSQAGAPRTCAGQGCVHFHGDKEPTGSSLATSLSFFPVVLRVGTLAGIGSGALPGDVLRMHIWGC